MAPNFVHITPDHINVRALIHRKGHLGTHFGTVEALLEGVLANMLQICLSDSGFYSQSGLNTNTSL